MIQLLIAHAAHLVFVAVGVIAFFWTAHRNPGPDRAAAPTRSRALGLSEGQGDRQPLSVRRSTAGRGLLALGPLVAAIGTGAVLYGVNVGGVAVPGAVIWVHAGISLLALVLVGYKLNSVTLSGLSGVSIRLRLTGSVSVALGVVSVPIVVSGVALLVAPSGGSFAAYSHLIASVWWTGLLFWHLRRYLGPSLQALARPAAPGPAPEGSRMFSSRPPRNG